MVFQVIWLLHLKRLFNCMTSWLNSGPTKNPCRSAVNSLGINLLQERITNKYLTALFQLCLLNFSWQKLSPEQYFLENKLIPKNQARQYELAVKKEFKSWADEKQLKKVKK